MTEITQSMESQRDNNIIAGLARQVETQEDYQLAGIAIRNAKQFIKAVKDKFKEPKRSAKEAHTRIVGLEKEFIAPVEESAKGLGRLMERFEAKQAEEVRRKEAERIEEMARQERIRLDVASRAAKNGNFEKVERIMSKDLSEPPPPVAVKVQGVSYRDNWQWRIVCEAEVPRDYLKLVIDKDKIDRIVKDLKGDAAIPGVLIENNRITVARAK